MSSKEQWPQRDTYKSPLSFVRFSVREGKERYRWATNIIGETDGKSFVIDAATGSGWGASVLRKSSPDAHVLGIDIDDEVIKKAQIQYGNESVLFLTENLVHLSPSTIKQKFRHIGNFTHIVSFETLEHVSVEDGRRLLSNFRELLSPHGGFLFLSTPNKQISSEHFPKPLIPGHIYEYTGGALRNALEETGFKIEEVFGQRFVNLNFYQKYTQIISFAYKLNEQLIQRGVNMYQSVPYRLLTIFCAASHPRPNVEPLSVLNHLGKQPKIWVVRCSI